MVGDTYHTNANGNRTWAQVFREGDQHSWLHGSGQCVQQVVRFTQDDYKWESKFSWTD